ncbi:MAG: methyl-accepting chemotaxis protein [Deltaproteobacteria bacterium]|jgi:methyl-accepting chemotaxis protein|nr:methyl-accepting chemotaxis protein [Deltaproteobacteria bacterium]
MTTKYKIIGGFAAMVIIVLALAFTGERTARTSSEDLDEYAHIASLDTMLSDMNTRVYTAAYHRTRFIISGDPAEVEQALKALDAMSGLAEKMLPLALSERTRSAIQDVQRMLPEYRRLFLDLRKDVVACREQYYKTFIPLAGEMREAFEHIAASSTAAGDVRALQTLTEVLDSVAVARVYAALFAETLSESNLKVAEVSLAEADKEIARLGTIVQSEAGKRSLAEVRAAYGKLAASFGILKRAGLSANESNEKNREVSQTILGIVEEREKDAAERSAATRVKALEEAEAARATVLALSAAGFVLALAVAFFIVLGLTRVLGRLGAYARKIADGDFNADSQVREGGEIGRMIADMKAIPEALKAILAEYQSLEKHIGAGQLTAQGDPSRYRGEFATLIKGTNGILARFLTVLENIPSPVVMLNKDLKASYLNTVARNIAGSNYEGKTCFDLFARDDFHSNDCCLKKAVAAKQSASGETRAHPQGRDLDISYTVIPMLTASGELASVLQLITDLTAIKAQAGKIQQAANEASAISSRVAAASEELAAQVEQISRGAETQKSRMESTATAMTQMNATVLEVAGSAGKASEQSDNTRRNAESGAELVNNVVRSMDDLNNVAAGLQENMQKLGGLAENIGNVMGVISDIADQTNLLALNAAIEAARAGEAGRGFAVVADEVRKLAEKTMHATHEVGDSITAIQSSARDNLAHVESAGVKIAEAAKLANTSGGALQEIVALAAATSQVMASIATAAEQQSSTSEEIARSIDDINNIVGETADGMVQSSSAVQDLSRMAQELRVVMDELRG